MQTRAKTKTLAELGLAARGGAETRITGLSVDSRDVKEGHLFAALPGTKVHGAEFIQYALRMRAGAILTDREGAAIAANEIAAAGVPVVVAEDPREALAFTAALWFEAQPETMVAVTGTNGKTSVSTFARQLWIEMGREAVNLGTTGVEGAFTAPLKHTTPEPITLHRMLARLAEAGITHAAMEASSHGLAQRRCDGVRLAAAAFTNLSQDHLDYHTDFEDYFQAKAGLFNRVLDEDGTAVVNMDDDWGPRMAEIAEDMGQDLLTVGRDDGVALRILGQRFSQTGQELRFEWAGRVRHVSLGLIGGFQADNALLAAGLCIGTGSDPDEVFDSLHALQTVRGRMQFAARRDNGAAVFVDYAHTPDALATALKAIRPHVMGRLIVVFGAGGDRDSGKRPLMGRAAADHADIAIVTDDNPRSEDPAAIRAAILKGANLGGADVSEVADRAEAILRGVDALGPGDTLLIAGKGHETGQIVGDAVLPFDDVEQASVAVAALDGRPA
ncbi:UDP-N-acetylmuramoyl-L-alanyl-D-glutamate--2,6-diaminopimelate ligase [Alphaproteobacteria bacterium GH1-50]|uniref:UDP-N-acetylmuramoyl-L-alanyl-D-glutamate--2,6-diaminopimelate ligase n=1 Tax=Kangsaoukella pontilimi TaxID=2691042 RepID=A0A7C9MTZ2_9RHOB|nr:UDP-N-acetylmuramoyl-L-alanyl-D-glutamate--2,6-diaminopimelate ligase [Kangsaoukella pontilimi]MXQ06540.1 UDP-N-acetylmuramoyl-L-alanyl-D-glutamate--2,6-diaminopimelate ligase [Kangsaoukella pontilimi]